MTKFRALALAALAVLGLGAVIASDACAQGRNCVQRCYGNTCYWTCY